MGLIGENGAGKSTTIKCILNLIRRDSGTIRVLGMDNLREERAVKEQIGVVLDECTFHETLRACEVGKILSRIYRRWDSACFEDYLRKFGLPRDKTIKEYSKGMKMKLSIASALSARPRLLILDEATSALDNDTEAAIMESINRLHGRKTLIIIAHRLQTIEKCDIVYRVEDGRAKIERGNL